MRLASKSVLKCLFLGYVSVIGFVTTQAATAACPAGNTCFGMNALQAVTTGGGNSAFGEEALSSTTSGTTTQRLEWDH